MMPIVLGAKNVSPHAAEDMTLLAKPLAASQRGHVLKRGVTKRAANLFQTDVSRQATGDQGRQKGADRNALQTGARRVNPELLNWRKRVARDRRFEDTAVLVKKLKSEA